ncbi:MAG: hypothetical protein AB7F23_05890 [Phycisphaerae bacterium]
MATRGKKPLYESIGRSMGPLMRDGRPADMRSGEYLERQKPEDGNRRKTLRYSVIAAAALIIVSSVVIITVLAGKLKENEPLSTEVSEMPSVKITEKSQTELDKSPDVEYNAPSISPQSQMEGSNRIVVATYPVSRDLQPVVDYYAANGIELEIVPIGQICYLVSVSRFDSFAEGSEGSEYLALVKRVGLNYKAPQGYERFSSRPFQDAYGKKMD